MKNIIKKNYLNLFFFLFFCLFWVEPTLCEGVDSFQEENLSSNENHMGKENRNTSDYYKKALILSGCIILVSLCFLYFTGNSFDNNINDIDVDTVTNVIKDMDMQVSEKRTPAERRAFMKSFHVGLQIPSWW